MCFHVWVSFLFHKTSLGPDGVSGLFQLLSYCPDPNPEENMKHDRNLKKAVSSVVGQIMKKPLKVPKSQGGFVRLCGWAFVFAYWAASGLGCSMQDLRFLGRSSVLCTLSLAVDTGSVLWVFCAVHALSLAVDTGSRALRLQ